MMEPEVKFEVSLNLSALSIFQRHHGGTTKEETLQRVLEAHYQHCVERIADGGKCSVKEVKSQTPAGADR